MDSKKEIKTILVDDHPVVINGLKFLLADIADIKLISEFVNAESAILFLQNHPVDLVISDISMPGMDGIELTKLIKKDYPFTKVLLLTAFNEREILKKALYSGAEACLLKNTSKEELLVAIYKIADNGYYYCDNLLEIARSIDIETETITDGRVSLSDREIEIMELLLKGCSNKEVADILNISYHTVTTHRKNTMKKTKSNNISGLYVFARKNKLFPYLFASK